MQRGSRIVYHGTDAVKAKHILKEGFNIGTYFALHLEDALGYGGAWIFEVAFPYHLIPKGNWQFRIGTKVPPEFIIRLTQYKPAQIKHDNMILRHMVNRSNHNKRQILYTEKDMKAHPERYSNEELIAWGMKSASAKE